VGAPELTPAPRLQGPRNSFRSAPIPSTSTGHECHHVAVISLMIGAIAASLLLTLAQSTVTTSEAEKLAAAYVRSYHKGPVYWRPSPKLKEITTSEIAGKLRAQVFKIVGYSSSTTEPESYLVKNGKAYPLSIGFGGYGLMSTCVADLDGDRVPELAYTYSWGSGMHRTHIEAMLFGERFPTKIATSFQVRDVDLRLSRTASGVVNVYATRMNISPADGSKDLLLGRLTLTKQGKGQVLDLTLQPHLPKQWRDLIWRYKAS
jgi:hypothetical protein